MRKAKNAIFTPVTRTGSVDSHKDSSFTRRPSFASAVHAFAADLRETPKSALARISQARKSVDNLALVSAKSKSCSNLPSTATDSPLLTLQLPGTSFLDTAVMVGEDRFYMIDTQGTRTNISREDHLRGTTHVGEINWLNERESKPVGTRSNATIQMAHGRQYLVDDFLRRTKFSSSRLFSIPHYPHTLKWKRSGSLYRLLVSKSKLVVATLEPSTSNEAPRIKVLESLHELDGSRPQLEYRGVPVLVLDFIIATALLVVADKGECIFARKSAPLAVRSSTVPPRSASQFAQQWRLDVQTEPFSDFISRSTGPSRSLVGHSASSAIVISSSHSEFGIVPRPNNSDARSPSSRRVRGSNLRPRTAPDPARNVFNSVYSESDDGTEDASQVDDSLSSVSLILREEESTIEGPDDDFLKRHMRRRSASDSGASPEAPSQSSAGSQSSAPWLSTASAPVSQQHVPVSTTGSRRPFRPLPRIPVPGAGDIPPVPSLPASPSPMATLTSYSPEQSVAGPSRLSRLTAPTSFTSKESSEGTLKRSPSETTITPLYSSDDVPQSHTSTDNSLSKPIHRRSIFKHVASPSSTQYSSGPSDPHRTIPAAPPLRLNTYSNWDAGRFPSSSSHSQHPSIYSLPPHPPPEDEYSGFFPPPSYDSIDFS